MKEFIQASRQQWIDTQKRMTSHPAARLLNGIYRGVFIFGGITVLSRTSYTEALSHGLLGLTLPELAAQLVMHLPQNTRIGEKILDRVASMVPLDIRLTPLESINRPAYPSETKAFVDGILEKMKAAKIVAPEFSFEIGKPDDNTKRQNEFTGEWEFSDARKMEVRLSPHNLSKEEGSSALVMTIDIKNTDIRTIFRAPDTIRQKEWIQYGVFLVRRNGSSEYRMVENGNLPDPATLDEPRTPLVSLKSLNDLQLQITNATFLVGV